MTTPQPLTIDQAVDMLHDIADAYLALCEMREPGSSSPTGEDPGRVSGGAAMVAAPADLTVIIAMQEVEHLARHAGPLIGRRAGSDVEHRIRLLAEREGALEALLDDDADDRLREAWEDRLWHLHGLVMDVAHPDRPKPRRIPLERGVSDRCAEPECEGVYLMLIDHRTHVHDDGTECLDPQRHRHGPPRAPRLDWTCSHDSTHTVAQSEWTRLMLQYRHDQEVAMEELRARRRVTSRQMAALVA